MNQLTRRQALALMGTTTLAACAGGSALVPSWVGAIEAIGQQVALDAPQLKVAGLPAASLTQVSSIDGQIESAAAAIGAESTATQGQSTLIQIEGYVNAVAPIVEPFLETAAGAAVPGGGFAIALIVAALPALEFALNMTVSQLTAQAQAIGAKAVLPASAVFGSGAMDRSQQALNELLRRAGK
jgi:hypothetical protein